MIFLKNEEIVIQKWRDFLAKFEQYSPFHTPEYYESFINDEYYKTEVFAIEHNGIYKSLAVVCIQKEPGLKGYFSKRGIIYGSPIFETGGGEFLKELVSEIRNFYNRRLIYLEVRCNSDLKYLTPLFNSIDFEYEDRLNVQLDIRNSTLAEVLSKMKYSRRRQIKLSYEQNVITRLACDNSEVLQLYAILKDLYAEKVKLPLNQISFFINLFKSKRGLVFVVLDKEKIIGGAFCVYNERMILNTIYYAGLKDYNKKIFPTHLALMAAIEFGIENGLKMIDFMGAGKPNIEYGVRDYKLRFGGELVENGRFQAILNPQLYALGTLGLKFFNKIKS